jgi:hypothetical protein
MTMAAKSDFSAEQWHTIREVPHLVVISMAAAGASGLIGSLKEAFAPAGAMIEAIKSDNSLLQDVCNKDEMRAAVDALKEEAKASDFASVRDHFRDAAKSRAREAIAILKEKATPADVTAYSDFLLELADRVANAAKEGAFLGFGGERVSEPERALLAELADALGRPAGALQA